MSEEYRKMTQGEIQAIASGTIKGAYNELVTANVPIDKRMDIIDREHYPFRLTDKGYGSPERGKTQNRIWQEEIDKYRSDIRRVKAWDGTMRG